MKKTIIALGYKARSGKDTVGKLLVERHGFKRVAFADALKDGCSAMFGIVRPDFDVEPYKSNEHPFWKVSPRYIAQHVGTECMREHFDPLIWARTVENRIFNLDPFVERWVITDLRFRNEAEAVLHWGGFPVRLVRPGCGLDTTRFPESVIASLMRGGRLARAIGEGAIESLGVPPYWFHQSETDLDGWAGWKAELNNSESLDNLPARVSDLLSNLGVACK